MTVTDPAPPTALAAELLVAGPAALAAIPGADGWTVHAADLAGALPAPEARTVEARLGGARLLLVVDAELARHLQVGPPPAEDLVEGALPALRAVATALGEDADGLADVQETSGPAAGDGAGVAVVALHDADAHRASLVLLAAAVPATPAAADPVPAAAGPRAPASPAARVDPTGLELLHDVELAVTVELGRTRMLVRDVLDLVPGSVIELDRAAGSPVDVLVNGTMIARGEVVVIDEEFGVRITEVIGYEDGPAR
jgi:flagellar motor switch protein FliN/FliY